MRVARWPVAAFVSLGVALSPARAQAAACSVANVTPLSFGTYPLMTPVPIDTMGELAIECSSPTAVRITLGRGMSGHQSPREMRSGAGALLYNLFSDAARTIVWGDGAQGTLPVFAATAPGQPLRLPIFGRIFPLQAVPSGTYTDRIIVAVVF